MTILLTGGNGRTSSAIARRLNDAKVPFVVLSRSGTAPAPFKACGFDWCDENTYSTPFSQAIAIDALYIVVPIINMDDPASPIIRFIDFAKAKGVKRFVLLSASNVEPGRRIMGDVHQHLISANVDHVVLRPTWYMDNFSRNQAHTVVTEGKIYSTVEDGKIPWISSDDVGAVGYHALVDDSVTERELILLGPELLSYDEIAAILSKVTGRQIDHVRLPQAAFKRGLLSAGLSDSWAQILVDMEAEAANHEEERLNNEVLRITGKSPVKFQAWAEANKGVWM